MNKLLIPVVLLALILCGCSGVPDVDVDAILTGVVERIDWEQLQEAIQKGSDVLVEKFPALKPLTDSQQMKALLKDQGLKLLAKYLESADQETQENAQKLGAILKILSPELSDEVDTVLGE